MASSEIKDYVMDDEAVQMLEDDTGDVECLQTRKWWCFLLSSILTFVMGVSGVFVLRVLKFIFCREVSW